MADFDGTMVNIGNRVWGGARIFTRPIVLRNILAQIIDGVAYDVQIESRLQPLAVEEPHSTSNNELEARLNIFARGFG